MWKWGAVAGVTLALTAFLALGREMHVVPIEPVRIVKDVSDRTLSDVGKTLAVLPPAEPVLVTECLNLVDDQVYRVKSAEGQEGYIASGRYRVERKSWWDSLGGTRVICH